MAPVPPPTHDPAPALDDSLAAPFRRLEDAEVADLLLDGWGVAAVSLRRLATERDDTFLVEASGSRTVLKVAHPLDDPAVLDLQCAALAHVADRDPDLPVPRVVADSGGGWLRPLLSGSEPRVARLLTYLPGTVLDYAATTVEQRRAIGRSLARLSLALADFAHPAARRELAWDLQRVGTLRPLLHHVADDAARADAMTVLDRYDAWVGPALATTRMQVVHHDLNPDNVLTDPGDPAYVTGILDFGDVVHSSVAADLAVAMAYAVGAGTPSPNHDVDPWAAPYDVAAGFTELRPLEPDEARLLPELVRARLAQRQIVNSWLAASDPSNADYTGRSLAHSAGALRLLVGTPAPSEGA